MSRQTNADGAQIALAAIRVPRTTKPAQARRDDPHELLPMTEAELEVARDTAVGKAFGLEAGQLSRDGRVAVITLGKGRP